MTFEEWWGGDRDRTTAYDLMKVLSEAAAQAWHSAEAATREEMLAQWNRTGVDIDAALHGRVNEKSPIANRLRMIAAAQPRWQPIATAPKDGAEVLLALGDEQAVGDRIGDRGWMTSGGLLDAERLHGEPTHWMRLPPPPEKTK